MSPRPNPENSHDPAFSGKVVLVTGGSNGIGKQLAIDLSRLGAKVTVCGQHPASVEQSRLEFLQSGLQIDAQTCDIRVMTQVDQLVDHVRNQHGPVDMLVNNAGYAVYRAFEESSTDEVLDLLDVNLAGAMRCAKAALPDMISRRSGRIVNIASIGGQAIVTPNAVYCAAKHGMVAWTKAIRYELARFNVKVTVVCPGLTTTNFHADPTFRRRDPYRGRKGRAMTVEVVSASILRAIRQDRVVAFVPAWHRWMVWALNAFPGITTPVWDRITRRRVAQLYEQMGKEL